MLNCKQITQSADKYLEHDLSLMQRLGYKMHLMMCVHCRRYLAQYQTTKKVVKRVLKQTATTMDYRPAWQRIQQWRAQNENQNQSQSDSKPKS